jgi:hypothetical protein
MFSGTILYDITTNVNAASAEVLGKEIIKEIQPALDDKYKQILLITLLIRSHGSTQVLQKQQVYT